MTTCSCCGPAHAPSTATDIRISIDGQPILVEAGEANLVDVASRAGIGIPAPCYRAERSKGCCNGCVVEINGEQKFACSTAPEDGMEIVLNRPDLVALRKERLAEYAHGIKTGNPCECSTSESCCG